MNFELKHGLDWSRNNGVLIHKSLEALAEALSITVVQVTTQVEKFPGAVINLALSREELQSVTRIKHR